MITLTLNLPNYLNVSLQVGDMIYARTTLQQIGANDLQGGLTAGFDGDPTVVTVDTDQVHVVGVLSRINSLDNNLWTLDVDDTVVQNPYAPLDNDFIMFSKYDQSAGDLIGYYAKVKFVNNSHEKAEIFSVGSEVIINSK